MVKHIRQLMGKRIRVGHTGTLDPFATGLLIIAIDRTATKHIKHLLSLDKTYRASGKLGELTDSFDTEGTVLSRQEIDHLSHKDLQNAITSLGSSYNQKAPIYSALKYNGNRLCDLARSKQLTSEQLEAIAELKQREVILYNLELLELSLPFFTVKAHVSSGTYLRSLVNDIAKKAGTVATTYELERTAIGPFTLEHAYKLEQITSVDDIAQHCIPIIKVLEQLERYKK